VRMRDSGIVDKNSRRGKKLLKPVEQPDILRLYTT